MNKLNNHELSSGHIDRIGDSINIDGNEITFEQLHEKYGPEGIYEIANKLWNLADNDINLAIKQSMEYGN